MEKLGVTSALARRFARLDELSLDWRPTREPTSGIFANLRTDSGRAKIPLGMQRMTWEKFTRIVLPGAQKLELQLATHHSFIALTTAADPNAPPILKWDFLAARNPVGWYCYSRFTSSTQWNLRGTFVPVTGICRLPCEWGAFDHPHYRGAVLILEGCVDRNNSASGLFPENLKPEFHSIRSTIEAHSNTTPLTGQVKASACGVDVRPNRTENLMLRVTTSTTQGMVMIDRWD